MSRKIRFFSFFRAAREGVRGKPPGTAEAIAEDPAIMGGFRGARDETPGVKNVKMKLWVYKLHFTKQGLFTFYAFQNLHKLINCDIKSYLNLCTFAVFHS